MVILLKEIALRYTETNPNQMFWDYFAMYQLWSQFGSEALKRGGGTIAPGNKNQIVDTLFEEVANAFADKILQLINTAVGKLNEDFNADQLKIGEVVTRLGKKLAHARKVGDMMEMHGAINDLFRIAERERTIFQNAFEGWNINPETIKNQRRMDNIARYIPLVSPVVAQVIKANLGQMIGYDKVDAEVGKDAKVDNAKEPFTPEDKATLTASGITFQTPTLGVFVIKPLRRVWVKKNKEGEIVISSQDRGIVNVFPTAEELVQYIKDQGWRDMLPARGVDFAPNAPAAPKPAPAPAPAPKPVAPPVVPPKPDNAMPNMMAGNEPKRLGATWEKLLGDFGYVWDDAQKVYANHKRGVTMTVMPNNSVDVKLRNGNVKSFPNLGELFRKLAHNKAKRHANDKAPAGEPAAQLKEAHYRELFRFLYN